MVSESPPAKVSVPVYGVAHVPAAMFRTPVRVRCVAIMLSAAVITAVALTASQPMPFFSAESSAAWSASCCNWFFCHSTEPASKTSAAEPMRASSASATSTITCPDCDLERCNLELHPLDGLGIERGHGRDPQESGQHRLPFELQIHDHALMTRRADGCAVDVDARRCAAAPPRIGTAGGGVQLVDEYVNRVRDRGSRQRDGAGLLWVGVSHVRAVCGGR